MSNNKASGGKFTVPVVIAALVAVGLIFMNKGFNTESMKEAAEVAANTTTSASLSNPAKIIANTLEEATAMTPEKLAAVSPSAGQEAEKIADSASATASATIEMAANTATQIEDSAKKAAETINAEISKKLPNGSEIKTSESGIEAKLMAFIEDKSKPVDKDTWFDFDRLAFDAGKSTLAPASQEQLKNITEIMSAYPSVKIKIGGYTDNTGNSDENMKLSQSRAEAVKSELIKMGVSASRLSAEGYGSQFPVASNDSEEGRSKNRRIAARITEK